MGKKSQNLITEGDGRKDGAGMKKQREVNEMYVEKERERERGISN